MIVLKMIKGCMELFGLTAVLGIIFTVSYFTEGRKCRNPRYATTDYIDVRIDPTERFQYINLPSGKGRGVISEEKLTTRDKQFLETFWAEIKEKRVDKMKIRVGMRRFREVENKCLAKFR